MTSSTAPIPPFSFQSYKDGILHPSLWLWDSWTYKEGNSLHLYALGLSRETADGSPILPDHRNNYPFHFRHFESFDHGNSWMDLGAVLRPSKDPNSYYSRNVWSGSATRLSDNRKLMGFTGLREVDNDHPFLQSIGIGISSDGMAFDSIQKEAISCPRRDYDDIIKAGYYLGPKEDLGHKDGEHGGPILAWRDPYIFIDKTGTIHCFWSAKISPKVGAIAHATLVETEAGFKIDKLHPPITLPDGDTITQAEVPKIYFDEHKAIYYCLVSACDRLNETQADEEVSKTLRLYKSSNLRGPWETYAKDTSILPNLPHMFGASIVDTNFLTGDIQLIAPVTERAHIDKQLSFAPIQTVNIYSSAKTNQAAS